MKQLKYFHQWEFSPSINKFDSIFDSKINGFQNALFCYKDVIIRNYT